MKRPSPQDRALGWLSSADASARWSVTERTLRKWRNRGILESEIRSPDGVARRRVFYRVAVHHDDTPHTPPPSGDGDNTHRSPAHTPQRDGGTVEDATPAALRVGPDSGWVERDGFVYDGSRDTYVIQTPSQGRPLVWPGERVRQLWRAYTDGATQAEITRRFALSAALWQEVKQSLRLTHSRAPWTDEELEASDEDALVEDGLRAKERAVLSRVERAEWRRVKADAERWRHLRASVLEYLTGQWEIQGREIPTPPHHPGAPWLVFGATDLHVGKRTHGTPGDLDGQLRELAEWMGRGVERIRHRPLAGIVLPVGSDLLHSDTYGQTTTRGTPQGAQAVGSIYQQIRGATELLCGLVDRLATIAPVRAVWIPGNHDEVLSYCVALALAERYATCPSVEVDVRETRRKVVLCGDVPLLLTHGDKIKARDLPGVVARCCPPGVDPRRAVIVKGHTHKADKDHDEISGVDVVTLTSPAHADDWHHASGYDLSQSRLTLATVGSEGLVCLEWVR